MKQIISISLALLLLAGQMSFAIGTHFCGGLAVKTQWMIGHDHLDCGMPDMETICQRENQTQKHFRPQPCCENQYFSYEVEDDFNLVVGASSPDFVAAFVYSFLKIPFYQEVTQPKYTHYYPPPLSPDFQTLFQSFLI